jgi:hypothetical protein
MGRTELNPVATLDLRPGTTYVAVCNRPSMNELVKGIRFRNSVSAPISAEMGRKLKAGLLCRFYEWRPDLRVEWTDGPDRAPSVYVDTPERPKRRRRKKTKAERAE